SEALIEGQRGLAFYPASVPKRSVVAELLSRNGSLDAALALLTARRFDGAVLDGRMPGLSGPQVLARVRPELPDLPVVVISGGDGSVARTDPCTRFLSKPFGPGELVRTMAELVQE
ncbi:MAG: response regulator, partial [Gemmataceae bacterium]|nr:response regulator [Gemmataceae bacterium]